MKFVSICSGSKGNCSLIIDDNVVLLIDCGSSQKYIKSKLEELDISLDQIDAVLITHAHSDHIKGINLFKDKMKYSCANIEKVNGIEPFQTMDIKGIRVTPIPLSHDSPNTCGYIFEKGYEKIVTMTDTGYVSSRLYSYIHNADLYFIESNHDVGMLMKTDRPHSTKARILSDNGHLCNEDCMNVLKNIIGPSTKEIILAHLSEEANDEKLAYDVTKTMIQSHEIYNLIKLKVAPAFGICKGGSWNE